MWNVLLYCFVSGLAFFPGALLLLLGVGLPPFLKRGWKRRLVGGLAYLGIALVAASTTPLPTGFYGLWAAALVACPLAGRLGRDTLQKIAIGGAAALTILACALEGTFARSPSLTCLGSNLCVIGDSLSAGLGGEKATWPQRLQAERAGIVVTNLAQPGATARTALRQADRLPAPETSVLVEIGGNDLLGGTPTAEFERDLAALLQRLTAEGRTVVMFELPLYPTGLAYGRIQRQMAARYHVPLIPKRHLAWVLLGPNGTSGDGLHLSEQGHQRMALLVRGLLEGS